MKGIFWGSARTPILVMFVLLCILSTLMFFREQSLRQAEQSRITPLEQQLSSLKNENLQQEKRILALRETGDRLRNNRKEAFEETEISTSPPAPVESSPAADNYEDQADSFSIQSRVASIDKFMALTEEQRERLRLKFKAEESRSKDGNGPEVEALEEIIGSEGAAFYREEKQKAIGRRNFRETEKEVLYLSRRLALDLNQEDKLREAMLAVDEELQRRRAEAPDTGRAGKQTRQDPRQVMNMLIREAREKRELLRGELKAFLSPEQYQLYLEQESEAPEADLEVWHATDE